MVPAYNVAQIFELILYSSATVIRILQVDPVDEPHQLKVTLAHRDRLIGEA